MTTGETLDILGKWRDEETWLDCTVSLDELVFKLRCRVSLLDKDSFTLSSVAGDSLLAFKVDSPDAVFSYKEPREISSALGLSLTGEQDSASTVVILLHPDSFPKDSSKPRDKLVLMEVVE